MLLRVLAVCSCSIFITSFNITAVANQQIPPPSTQILNQTPAAPVTPSITPVTPAAPEETDWLNELQATWNALPSAEQLTSLSDQGTAWATDQLAAGNAWLMEQKTAVAAELQTAYTVASTTLTALQDQAAATTTSAVASIQAKAEQRLAKAAEAVTSNAAAAREFAAKTGDLSSKATTWAGTQAENWLASSSTKSEPPTPSPTQPDPLADQPSAEDTTATDWRRSASDLVGAAVGAAAGQQIGQWSFTRRASDLYRQALTEMPVVSQSTIEQFYSAPNPNLPWSTAKSALEKSGHDTSIKATVRAAAAIPRVQATKTALAQFQAANAEIAASHWYGGHLQNAALRVGTVYADLITYWKDLNATFPSSMQRLDTSRVTLADAEQAFADFRATLARNSTADGNIKKLETAVTKITGKARIIAYSLSPTCHTISPECQGANAFETPNESGTTAAARKAAEDRLLATQKTIIENTNKAIQEATKTLGEAPPKSVASANLNVEATAKAIESLTVAQLGTSAEATALAEKIAANGGKLTASVLKEAAKDGVSGLSKARLQGGAIGGVAGLIVVEGFMAFAKDAADEPLSVLGDASWNVAFGDAELTKDTALSTIQQAKGAFNVTALDTGHNFALSANHLTCSFPGTSTANCAPGYLLIETIYISAKQSKPIDQKQFLAILKSI